MGLLSRIKGKSENSTDDKSSNEIHEKIEIKSSEDIQKEQVENELDALRSELSEKSSHLESISGKLGMVKKEYEEIITKTMDAKKLLNENKNAINEIQEAKNNLDEAKAELNQEKLGLEKINTQKNDIEVNLTELIKKKQNVDSEFEQRTNELILIKKQLAELKTEKKKETGENSKQIVESASQVVAATNKRLQKALEELEMVKRILEKEKAEHAQLKKKVQS